MIEGSGAGSESGSPKNIWILRIRNTDRNFKGLYIVIFLCMKLVPVAHF